MQLFSPTYWFPPPAEKIPIQTIDVPLLPLRPAIEEVTINNKQIKLINDYHEKAKLALYVIDLQKQIRGWIVREEIAKIDQIRSNVLQKINSLNALIKNMENQELIEIKLKTELQDELDSMEINLKDLQIKVFSFFEQKIENSGSKELEKRLEQCTKVINYLYLSISHAKEDREMCLAKAESEIDTILKNLTNQRNESQNPTQVPEVVPCDKLLKDIGCDVHQQLKALISQLFEKVPKETVLSWEYQSHDPSGKFKIVLKSPVKIWILPRGDDGKYDARTPKGVILILGNQKENAISGTFGKKQHVINFASGFETFCQYSQNVVLTTVTGYAAGKLDHLSYDEKKERILIRTTSTALGYNVTQTIDDSSHIKTLLQVWKEGIVVTEPNEDFLKKQQNIRN